MPEQSPFWTSLRAMQPGRFNDGSPAVQPKTQLDALAYNMAPGLINNLLGIGVKPLGPSPVSRFKTVTDYTGGAYNAADMARQVTRNSGGLLTQAMSTIPGNEAVTDTMRHITGDPYFREQVLQNPNLARLLPVL